MPAAHQQRYTKSRCQNNVKKVLVFFESSIHWPAFVMAPRSQEKAEQDKPTKACKHKGQEIRSGKKILCTFCLQSQPLADEAPMVWATIIKVRLKPNSRAF
jgi:hypothetical protein